MSLISWKLITGYECLYEVSSNSEVRSLDRVLLFKENGTRKLKGAILKQVVNSAGYPVVNLSKGNKAKLHTVHRLVAEAFIPNPDNLPQVNHKNGIKTDNRIENLEWVSVADNHIHAYRTNLRVSRSMSNESNPRAKLDSKSVKSIKQLFKDGHNTQKHFKMLAEKYNVTTACIRAIFNGRIWKDI